MASMREASVVAADAAAWCSEPRCFADAILSGVSVSSGRSANTPAQALQPPVLSEIDVGNSLREDPHLICGCDVAIRIEPVQHARGHT